MKTIIYRIGYYLRLFLEAYGQLVILTSRALYASRKIKYYLSEITAQYNSLAFHSIPLVFISSAFIGLVLGVQIGNQIGPTTPAWLEAGLILRSVLLEMGPMVTGLVLSGRIGAGIASELGTMNVTEQIDAFRSLGIDPVEFLVMPRLIACLIGLPVLVIFADTVNIFFGWISSYFTIDLRWSGFVRGMRHFFEARDIYISLTKAFLFGGIISIFGSYFGLRARHGARGVGGSTTLAVIWASIGIILFDYLISTATFLI